MTSAAAAPRPRLRVRMSREGRDEMRALWRSVAAHLALLLAIVAADWLHRLPFRQPKTVRVGLAPASALPRPARPPSAPPRPTAPAPRPEPPAVAPAPPEPEPEVPAPGIAPPEPEERPKPKPRERPRPSAPPAPSAAAAPSAASTPPGAGTSNLGIQAAVDGWEGGPGDPYLDGIVRRVSGKWLKPRTGLPPQSTTIYFEIDRQGRVSAISLEKPSGSAMFDRAALRAVELAAPVPPLPAGVRGASLKVHFEFLP